MKDIDLTICMGLSIYRTIWTFEYDVRMWVVGNYLTQGFFVLDPIPRALFRYIFKCFTCVLFSLMSTLVLEEINDDV